MNDIEYTEIDIKVICTEGFYWNLTSPYYRFKKGEIYDCVYKYFDDYRFIFIFKCCDLVTSSLGKNFTTIEEHREKQLNKIGI